MKKLLILLLGLFSLCVTATTPTISLKRLGVEISTHGGTSLDATINGTALTAVLASALPGDTITLKGKDGSFHGTYAGTFTVAQNIGIKGVGGSAILRPVSSELALVNNRVMNISSTGAIFENLTITGGNLLNGHGAGINVSAGGNRFRNCLFFNNQAESNGTAETWGGAFFIAKALTDRTYLENCQFINNAARGNKASTSQSTPHRGFGGAVGCDGLMSPITFTNCIFANNYAKTYGGAVASGSSKSITADVAQFINCTVVNNEILPATNSPALCLASGGGMTAINTIIYGNKGGASQLWAGPNSKYTNCAYEGTIAGTPSFLTRCFNLPSGISIFTKPTEVAGFNPTGAVPYDQADWSLSTLSYLINRGTDNSATLPKDILGKDRNQRGFVDLGAYESAEKGTIGLELLPVKAEIFVGEAVPSFTATTYPAYPAHTATIKGIPANTNTVGSYPISAEISTAIDLNYWNSTPIANATLKIKKADVASITLKRGATVVGVYGNTNGTSTENGRGITVALDAALDADTLFLSGKQDAFDGIYEGNFTLNKAVVIQGADNSVTLKASVNSRVMQISVANTTLINLTFTGGDLLNDHGAGIYLTAGGGCNIQNCTFINNQTASDGTVGVWGGAIAVNAGLTRSSFENCRFINNAAWGNKANTTQTGTHQAWGGAVGGLGLSSPMTFTNCLFANNYAKTYGGAFASGSSRGASAGDLLFINCTVVNNKILSTAKESSSGLNPASGAGSTITNSVICGNIGGDCQMWSGANSTFSNCAYEDTMLGNGGTITDCLQLTSGISNFTLPTEVAGINPTGAVTYDQADWSLLPSSYLINRGTDNSATLPKDILGKDRKQMNYVDLGAYESAEKGNIELSVSPTSADIYVGQPVPAFSVSFSPIFPLLVPEVKGVPENSNSAGQYTISAALNSAEMNYWNTPILNNGVLNITVPQPLPTPTNLLIEGQTPYSFTSKWNTVTNADSYEVSIFKQGETTSPLAKTTVNTPTYRFHWATPSTTYDLSIVAKSNIFPSSLELKGFATTIAAATTTIEPTAEPNTPTAWAIAFAGKEPTAESEVVVLANQKIVVDQASTTMRALRMIVPNSGEPALLSLSQSMNVVDALCAEITITDAEKGKWIFRSFPFDVHLQTGMRKVDGVNETNCIYWTDFRSYIYDGERRALEGRTDDNTKVWKEIKAEEETYLKKGTGYIFAIAQPGTYRIYAAEESLQTVLNPNSKEISLKEIPTTLSQTNAGWNMIGSPIFDRYNYSAEASDSRLPKFLYQYINGRYELLNALESTFVMKPYFAYLAQAPQATNWSIAYQAAQQNRSRTRAVSEEQISKYRFNLSKNGEPIDKTVVAFNPLASESFVINEDAVKMVYGGETRIWSTNQNGEALAYNQRPRIEDNGNTTVKAYLAEEASFTINRLDKSDEYSQILIRDTQTNEAPINLLTSDYTFKSKSKETKAFEITFKNTPTSIVQTPTTGNTIYSQGQSLFIQNKCDRIEIESIDGQRMATIANPKSGIVLPNGIYLIRITKGEEQEIIKYKH